MKWNPQCTSSKWNGYRIVNKRPSQIETNSFVYLKQKNINHNPILKIQTFSFLQSICSINKDNRVPSLINVKQLIHDRDCDSTEQHRLLLERDQMPIRPLQIERYQKMNVR